MRTNGKADALLPFAAIEPWCSYLAISDRLQPQVAARTPLACGDEVDPDYRCIVAEFFLINGIAYGLSSRRERTMSAPDAMVCAVTRRFGKSVGPMPDWPSKSVPS
jgi:hypothetical protein